MEKNDKGMRMEYLKCCVKNSAAKLKNHINPEPENYDCCYAFIRKRYDNKRELVSGMIKNILNMPKMKHESAESLKSCVIKYLL